MKTAEVTEPLVGDTSERLVLFLEMTAPLSVSKMAGDFTQKMLLARADKEVMRSGSTDSRIESNILDRDHFGCGVPPCFCRGMRLVSPDFSRPSKHTPEETRAEDDDASFIGFGRMTGWKYHCRARSSVSYMKSYSLIDHDGVFDQSRSGVMCWQKLQA